MNVQRYKVGYYTDEWGVSSSTPCLLKDPNGYAVKFDDYAMLAKQRDELLAALEGLCSLAECRPGYLHQYKAAVQDDHTAIASVKGK